ncbi:MAG TPA: hypothetical protein VHB68_08930 [Steroidobacteraceae bacterium]|nr:hypothetical protein [Steroidobacteraceae bacterium]
MKSEHTPRAAPAASGRKVVRLAGTAKPVQRLRRISFGATAAIVTSMGVIVGLNAATAQRATIIGSLLIIALADNLTDSLGVHVYQESERLAEQQAFRTTVANFATRLLVSLSFVAIVALIPTAARAILASLVWGSLLLAGLSYLLAKEREVAAWSEICKHCAVAAIVIALSAAIGTWIPRWLGG